MSLRDQLQRVYDERGELTPAGLVDVARPEAHPLHDKFEWDDGVAGEKYRRVQAAELIRSVRVVYGRHSDGRDKTIRAFVAVRGDDPVRSTYRPTDEAVTDPLTRQILVRECEREWQSFRRKYEALEEFANIVNGTERKTA